MTEPIKVLLVGGTWGTGKLINPDGRKSSVVQKMYDAIYELSKKEYNMDCQLFNGGDFYELKMCLTYASYADITIWMPNVPDNDLPKLRDVKAVAPKTVLVTSKRNFDNKYSFGDIVRRALGTKSNLLIEFTKGESKRFNMSVIDPLGNEWFNGTDIEQMVKILIERAIFLSRITRRPTTMADELFGKRNKVIATDAEKFIDIVQRCGKVFAEYTPSANNTTRLLGNCSLAQTTRCSKGFPTMRTSSGVVYVSQRNVDKQKLTVENLVPTKYKDGAICSKCR